MKKKTSQPNRSFFFLVPLLGISVTYFDADLFLNSYLKFPDRPELKQHLFLVFNKEKLEKDRMASFKLKQVNTYQESIFLNGFEILVHKISDLFLDELNLFKAGKYSKYSLLAKDKIIGPFFVKTTQGDTTLNYAALYPSASESQKHRETLEEYLGTILPKDAEILSLPNLALEEFKLSDFYELYSRESNDRNLTIH